MQKKNLLKYCYKSAIQGDLFFVLKLFFCNFIAIKLNLSHKS